jgi:hypothetical protein
MYLRGTRLASRCTLVVLTGHAAQAERRALAELGVRHVIEKGASAANRLQALLRRWASGDTESWTSSAH